VSVKDGDFTFWIKRGGSLRVLQGWIFAPTSVTRWRSGEMQRWLEFHCGTAFFWTSSVHPFATSLMFSSSRKFLLVSHRAR